ncbi:hypothetical protein ACFLZP_01045 [Patescibacteria group bacterium]
MGIKDKGRVKIRCLKDCQAWCCRDQELLFPFSDWEAKMLIEAGSFLQTVNTAAGRFYKLRKCAFLKNNCCLLHALPQQPQVCRQTKPSSQTCLECRKRNSL